MPPPLSEPDQEIRAAIVLVPMVWGATVDTDGIVAIGLNVSTGTLTRTVAEARCPPGSLIV